MIRKFAILIAVAAALLVPRFSAARIFIPIDQPIDKKFPIAVADLAKMEESSGVGSAAKKIADIIRNDLELSGYFFVIPKRAYLDRGKEVTAETIDFKKWTMIDASALVKGEIGQVEGRTVVQLKLFDTFDHEMLVGKQYTFEAKNLRDIAHRFSDEIMLSLTGIRGVFGTKIAFTRPLGRKGKSIYIMDMDGENEKRITKDNSISIGADWSPDGNKLAYSSYVLGFPDIYTVDLKNGHRRQLTANRATNITPSWSPLSTWIAYASSADGNMEIYFMDPDGGNKRRITNSFGIDLSPRFSPEGNEIVYVSERGGNVHLYKMALADGKSKRLTFVGGHNDSPDWAPDGQKIVFCGRVGGGFFDIFTVEEDGSNVQRLTIGSGTNEHPRWSPDSRFIVFDSTREGGPHIFMMRYDGAHQVRLTKKGGKKGAGFTPSWGPWTK